MVLVSALQRPASTATEAPPSSLISTASVKLSTAAPGTRIFKPCCFASDRAGSTAKMWPSTENR